MTATALVSERLVDIGDAREIIEEWLAETEGEFTPEIEALWNALTGREREKIENLALVIREISARADMIDAHPIVQDGKRLMARAKSLRNKVEWLKDSVLKPHVEKFGTPNKGGNPEMRGVLVTVALQNNSQPTVACVQPQLVHQGETGGQFVERVEHVEYILRRDAIIAAWKAKQPLPDAITVMQGTHVRIR